MRYSGARFVLIGAAIGATLMLAAIQSRLITSGADAKAAAQSKDYRPLDLFSFVFERVRTSYVERPDDSKLVASAINGMLLSLENSYYLDAKAVNQADACSGPRCTSALSNVGLAFTMQDGFATVETAVDDSPAAKAGIMAGDIITRLNDDPVEGLTLYQLLAKLRGDAGSTVKMSLVRLGRDKPLEVSLVREAIAPRSVRFSADGDVGYIRVMQFNEGTAEQLKKAVDTIAGQIGPDKVKGYILDLRNNPGGILEAGIATADDFLDDGEIVSIHGRKPGDVRHIRATPGDLGKGKPVVVLINGGSASMAEVVAAALQDNHRATVIGTRSFGEASIATLDSLGAGKGAIRLATERYVTPSGHAIQGKGIAPDTEITQDVPDDVKGAEKSASKQRPALQSYIPPDPKADKALNAAYEMLRGTKASAH